MRGKAFLLAALLVAAASGARGEDPDYRAQTGDTLWDLSERFWNDAATWPELWALNPHFHNPHFIYPEDPIFLDRRRPVRRPAREVIRLPVVRLAPGDETGVEPALPRGVAGADRAREGAAEPGVPRRVHLAALQALDFVAPSRLSRLGTVDNRHQIKVAYAEGEEVEVAVRGEGGLAAGDRVTLVDDSETVRHPDTGDLEGYYVRVLGQGVVDSLRGRRAVCRIVASYDAVEDGAGLVAYREPLAEVEVRAAPVGVEGVILRGEPSQTYFATQDMVFLDRGAAHGLDVGVLLEIPVREGRRAAQGAVDLDRPLAHVLVVSVQDATAAGVIVDSRATLEAGDRFVAAAVQAPTP